MTASLTHNSKLLTPILIYSTPTPPTPAYSCPLLALPGCPIPANISANLPNSKVSHSTPDLMCKMALAMFVFTSQWVQRSVKWLTCDSYFRCPICEIYPPSGTGKSQRANQSTRQLNKLIKRSIILSKNKLRFSNKETFPLDTSSSTIVQMKSNDSWMFCWQGVVWER